ncbi:hypothetical protein F7725_028457 [Dissostichus mawsoni]|uniref:Uncharacterized protein n=1 Tax=Dissostichus mawsoni TaxID=36200 RepID=A0A7J5XH15_DISMA|nr:hypothetical protein F7725_028427 [Dissostichus mawsoni]KAF3835899.1 hypothetical protein F7725_028457 [Dissostichus mawsoni]
MCRQLKLGLSKGPLGYLRQDPTDAARLLKDNPSLQDQHAPVKEAVVKQNALTVCQRMSSWWALALAPKTPGDIWDSRDDGYAAFIVKKKCAAGTRMHRLHVGHVLV